MKKSRRYQAVSSLAAALEHRQEAPENIPDIITALENEPDKKKRKKMMKEFAVRYKETADFFAENEAVINARAEAALISAAVSGDVNALKFYLKNRLPEKYSDKPKETVEIEDISGIEEKIYGSENEKDHTV